MKKGMFKIEASKIYEKICQIEQDIGFIGESGQEQEVFGLSREEFEWMVKIIKEKNNK